MESVAPPSTEPQEIYVVAIGASAGGLEAIHEFFDNMPNEGNFCFVIIQHLSSDHKSLLVELVSKHTNMNVLEATHEAELSRGCVYVIPNDKLLKVKGGRLQLSTKNFEKSPNTAIDMFLKSLADDQGSNAIAVILSGTGTDGTRGIEAIQQNGGLILVQDPHSAKFDGMPNSAIAAGYADFILSPDAMPEEIVNHIREKPLRKSPDDRPDEAALPEVMRLIEKHCGYDFHNYKSPTIIRRIMRRMNQLGKRRFSEYVEFLRGSGDECKTLGQEFLIGVTKFFRDSPAFDIFSAEVLPDVVRGKPEGEVIKVWVTACSTGQEAYTIAILINEQLRRVGRSLEVKIFATDLDMEAVETASRGTYSEASIADMDPDILNRYFERQGNNYSIIPLIRKQIVFARHNILKDPPFIKNDIISCRNMLIYMNSILQRKVFATLSYSLNNGGFLFLGPSEIPSSISGTLAEVSNKWKIYRKTGNEKFYQPHYDTMQSLKSSREVRATKENALAKDLAEDFKSALTDEFRYAAVYIDSNYDIKEAVGDFRHYLSLPQKIVNLNLLKMVDADLGMALNAALRKMVKEGSKVSLNHVKLKDAKEDRYINVYVKPPATRDAFILVVFGESGDVFTPSPKSSTMDAGNVHGDSKLYIAELEDELKDTRVNLQMAVESLETTNEELQSSNEELLSANEELQSSNEELQSLNEELHTLNTEHQLRIKELIDLNDDLNNYFRSTEIGQVFVDREQRIRKFNPAAVQLVNLIESDIGRPIDHISTNLRNENLAEDIRSVIRKKGVVEKEVELDKGLTILMRIMPYLRQNGEQDGVVITFFNITAIRELNHIIKGVFNSSMSAIMAFKAVRDQAGRITDFTWLAGNHESDKFLGMANEAYLHKSLHDHFPNLLSNGMFEKYAAVVEEDKPLHTELVFSHKGQPAWYEIIATKMMDGLVLTLTNTNEKKLSEEKLRKNYHELMRAKENLKALNASLEEMVAARTADLAGSEERFRLIAATASDIVWDWNLVNNEMWWSDSFYKIFGYDRNDQAAMTSAFWMKQIHPDEREDVVKQIYEAINNNSNWVCKYRLQKEDGSYASILGKGAVIANEFGIPYRMVGAMTDITASEQAEKQLLDKSSEMQRMMEEFRFVTDFMPQLVWSTQPDGYHDFYNKGWYDYTGLSYEETKDTGWNTVLHPEDQQRAWKVWRHSLDTGEPYEIEYRFRRHDGLFRWFLGRALPLRDERGTILKWFGTCTDIHDQKTMSDLLEQKVDERTKELLRSNDELEDMNTELMQFASVASHDLKEPLRKIHIFGNIIKDRYLKEADGAMDYMNRIINSSARMTKLINDLLSYSRLSVTHFFENVELNKIIAEVLSDLELSIQERGATISVDDLPEIQAVPGQLRQVLQNVISNSLKFTRADVAPHIAIQAAFLDSLSFHAKPVPQGDYLRLTITDNGIGFDEQYAAKIFTIFQRLHSREKYEGTGIGLAITKKIVDRHNGIVTAKSKEGQGSSFVIILPLKQEAGLQEQATTLVSAL
jgi:two-component system CheB/CheR fusion protein